jgi:hypothetical protein
MLSGGDGIPRGGIDHNDTPARRLVHIDVVNTDTGPTDYLKLAAGGDYLSSDLRLTAHQQTIVVTDNGHKLFRLQAGFNIHFGDGTYDFDTFFSYGVSNQNLHYRFLNPQINFSGDGQLPDTTQL